MCNCGNKRDKLEKTARVKLSDHVAGISIHSAMWKDINFTYTGKMGLTVTGTVTGKRYRFTSTGDVQLIDYRDASGMRSIPVLKRQ